MIRVLGKLSTVCEAVLKQENVRKREKNEKRGAQFQAASVLVGLREACNACRVPDTDLTAQAQLNTAEATAWAIESLLSKVSLLCLLVETFL